MSATPDAFGARASLTYAGGTAAFYRLAALSGLTNLDRLPHVVKIILENVLRNCGEGAFEESHVRAVAGWAPNGDKSAELPFLPARVLLQDYTGVPAIVDLAAMRSAMQRLGGSPAKVNPLMPVDLVIDHSVQIDVFGNDHAFADNVEREYERNRERYSLLRWSQGSFNALTVVPPGTGICHQVNLEFLSKVVQLREIAGQQVALPDTLIGTDSHTTMVNGLGVLGWGVGGIEAEGAMLGQPLYMLIPDVVGVRLTGALPEGATATDLVLTVTQLLRRHGVVGKFVEYFGEGLSRLPVADRATLGNMSPEYGATAGYFPVDNETLRYLRTTGRPDDLVDLVERYTKEQGLFRVEGAAEPTFDSVIELDMSTVEPSLAGPRRPQDRLSLSGVGKAFHEAYDTLIAANPATQDDGATHGSVAIASITSCTNTSNPSVMLGAGLLAKKAVERGLTVKPFVKTSLAPGSRAVTDYLDAAGLQPYLDKLGFNLVGYGCTTCIGNSGPLPPAVAKKVDDESLVVASVISGNRNFEGRIHPQVRASFLASPPLVVAYALAGTVDVDLANEPIGKGSDGKDVYLREIWPSQEEIRDAVTRTVTAQAFRQAYASVFEGDAQWRDMEAPTGELYEWDARSTYVQEPPYFENFSLEPDAPTDIEGARVLVMLGDSVTTDHISPAGNISPKGAAGQWLIDQDVPPFDFNNYGARRGAHDVMTRGTFGNIRLRNELVPGTEGSFSAHQPSGDVDTIFAVSSRYRNANIPSIVLGGKEYGTGSSRDWAAKGPRLLGVRACIVESYERIHRSNLLMMGVLPLQFKEGESRQSLGLTGTESYTIRGIAAGLKPRQELKVEVTRQDGSTFSFSAVTRIDAPIEWEYYRHGGILPMVLRGLATS
ncbi:MAG: aconitate hydratase AcnA [Chloroflexota bacterium]